MQVALTVPVVAVPDHPAVTVDVVVVTMVMMTMVVMTMVVMTMVVMAVVVTVGMMSGRGPRRERRRAERDSRGKSEQCSAVQHDTSLQGS